ncbi:hypothetical protein BOTBODRAFT_67438 [Botryobasidium botryosum FD-172 SS1]|uniref:Uncharacterized protein n=1 Tax=Botryobasidium botryosum (strain FD-172 SS1) TaxID=930990 RepID=A0A067M9G5_BOTB1|nr:hypothetical protein BOTBODRAFT_67438 [Botryobasidium botryosum FD-172 SS1]
MISVFLYAAVLCTQIPTSWALSISWPLDAPILSVVNISWSGEPPFQLSIRQHHDCPEYLEIAHFTNLTITSLTWPIAVPVGNLVFLKLTDATGYSVISNDMLVQAPGASATTSGDPATSAPAQTSPPIPPSTQTTTSTIATTSTTSVSSTTTASVFIPPVSEPPPASTPATGVPADPQADTSTPTSSRTTGIIVGGVFGGLAVVAFLFFILSHWIRRRRNAARGGPDDHNPGSQNGLLGPDEKGLGGGYVVGGYPASELRHRPLSNGPPPVISGPIIGGPLGLERQHESTPPGNNARQPGARQQSGVSPVQSVTSSQGRSRTSTGTFFPSTVPPPPRPRPTHQPKPKKKSFKNTLPSNPAQFTHGRSPQPPQPKPPRLLEPGNVVSEAPFLVLKAQDPFQEGPHTPQIQRGASLRSNASNPKSSSNLTFPPPPLPTIKVDAPRQLYPRPSENPWAEPGTTPAVSPGLPRPPPTPQTPASILMYGARKSPSPPGLSGRASLPVPPPPAVVMNGRDWDPPADDTGSSPHSSSPHSLSPHSARRTEVWEERSLDDAATIRGPAQRSPR